MSRPRLCGFLLGSCALALFPAILAAQTFVRPGDTGSIDFPIESDVESAVLAEGVEVTVEAPAHFTVKGTSIKGPLTIAPGETKTFTIDFEIAADAPDGSFDAVLKVSMVTTEVDPDPETLDTRVNIIRKRPSSLDEPA